MRLVPGVLSSSVTPLMLLVVPLAGASEIGTLQQPIIYGEDDRREVYEAESEIMRARAREAVVAFTSARSLSYDAGGLVSIHVPTLGETYGLCPGEAFAEQPTLAFCSGVLVDDDLVVTAGHCLGQGPTQIADTCAGAAIVFGYLYDAAAELAPLTADDVYRCRRVVAWQPGDVVTSPDYAVVQLDRPVSAGLVPAAFAPTDVELGQHINVIGFGAGLPAKIDGGAVVTDSSLGLTEYFSANTDTFAGASGSPIFDDAGQVVGLHVRGQPDWTSAGGCTVSTRAFSGDEYHQRASSVLNGICESGWPSPRLCNTPAVCGDGICSSAEACPGDCPSALCGDGRCEGGEPMSCGADCPSFVEVPADWTCTPAYYGDRLGCDCNCGARDVDCDDPAQGVLNCSPGALCGEDGWCRSSPDTEEPDGENPVVPATPDGEMLPDDVVVVDESELETEGEPAPRAEDDGGCAMSRSNAGRSSVFGAAALTLVQLLRRSRRRALSGIRC